MLSAMGIIVGNEFGNLNSNKAVCVSFHANDLGKGMYPSVLLPAMGK